MSQLNLSAARLHRFPWRLGVVDVRSFGRATNGLANLLNGLSLEPGPMVVLMPNSIEMDVAIMAVMSEGAQVAPVNPFFKVSEICKALDGFGATAIVCDATTRDKAYEAAESLGIGAVVTIGEGGEELGQWTGDASLDQRPGQMPAADDLALSIFTGGTTGVPKGVDHTHYGLMWGLVQTHPTQRGRRRLERVQGAGDRRHDLEVAARRVAAEGPVGVLVGDQEVDGGFDRRRHRDRRRRRRGHREVGSLLGAGGRREERPGER